MAEADGLSGPTQNSPMAWLRFGWHVTEQVGRDNVGLLAAGMAFYGLLAVFPGIAACMAIAGLVIDPSTVVHQFESYGQLLPRQAAEIIVGQASDVAAAQGSGLGIAVLVSVAITIYSASKGIRSMIQGLNVAFGVEEGRNIFMLYAVTFLFTAIVILGLLVALASTIVLPAVFAVLPLPAAVESTTSLVRWPVMAVFTILGLTLIYRYGPCRPKPDWRWVLPGAVFGCVVWIGGSMLFAVYVRNFSSYNETFGSLGGAVVLLMWLWLSAFIILLGAEINAELEKRAASYPSKS